MNRVIRFVNTFEPVAPLYQDLFPVLEARGWEPVALLSRAAYRQAGTAEAAYPFRTRQVWSPAAFRRHKRWAGLSYFLLAPLHLSREPAALDVFLTQPPMFFPLGGRISSRRHRPYMVHVMDLYPDLAAQYGMIRRQSAAYRLLARRSLHGLQRADGVLAIGRCMKEVLIAKGVEAERVVFVPNWSPVEGTAAARRTNIFRRAHGLEDAFIVLYSGNMGIAHLFDTVLAVAESLAGRREIVFVFAGYGVRQGQVEEAARRLPNVRVLGFQPPDVYAAMLGDADVHYLSLRSGVEGLVVPSKFYGAMVSGRPIIYEGTDFGEVARTIQEHDAGRVIEPGDADGLGAAILEYANHHDRAETAGHNARGAYERCYARDISVAAYVRTVERFLR